MAWCECFPEDAPYFLKEAKKCYDSAIEGFRHNDKKYIEKYKDLIFLMYSKIYLSNTPIFDNKEFDNLDGLSFVENIFSVKNTPNKKYKILTILGIKFKFKRKQCK